MAIEHKPAASGVMPCVLVQLLVQRKSRYAVSAAPAWKTPIQSDVLGLLTLFQVAITDPPPTTLVGLTLRLTGGGAVTVIGPDEASRVKLLFENSRNS